MTRHFNIPLLMRIAEQMDAARRRVAADSGAAPPATPGEIAMVEVAPGTFAPAPTERERRRTVNAAHPLAAIFEDLRREIDK